MDKKVFIVGLPGSGKSAAARYLEELASERYKVLRFNDYKILLEMAKADQDGLYFSSTRDKGHEGFDVHDLRVLPKALEILNKKILAVLSVERPDKNVRFPLQQMLLLLLMQIVNKLVRRKKDKLIIIEFSRDNYCHALEFFKALNLSEHTFFLFVDANVSACNKRIKSRVENPQTSDDYYVSEYIFEAYYQRDRGEYVYSTASYLEERFDVQPKYIHVVKNSQFQSLSIFQNKIAEAILPFLDEREVRHQPQNERILSNRPKSIIPSVQGWHKHKLNFRKTLISPETVSR